MQKTMPIPGVTKTLYIGMVINTAVKPSRDVMLGLMDWMRRRQGVEPRLFHASAATATKNLVEFASSGLDGLVFCGVRRDIVWDFAKAMPNHPPVVLSSYAPLSEEERRNLGNGGTVMLDNEAIGRQAADFLLGHKLQNFAFFGSNVYRERIAGEIRCEAFRKRIQERLGDKMTFSSLMVGTYRDNEDFWEGDENEIKEVKKWVKSLPIPCAVFVNGDREAFSILEHCHHQGIAVPADMEVLGVNNSHWLCEHSTPPLSSICPDLTSCVRKTMDMLIQLIQNPNLPSGQRDVRIESNKLIERRSTAGKRDYGHVLTKVREFVRQNACSGIAVPDIVAHVGASRRMIEKRIRMETGESLLDMIWRVRVEKACKLLKTTRYKMAEVARLSGFGTSTKMGRVFRTLVGMSMRTYRSKYRKSVR